MMNQGVSRFKQSKIEKLVNSIVLYLILIQAILCMLMAIFSGVFTNDYAEYTAAEAKTKAWYVYFTGAVAHRDFNSESLDYQPGKEGARTYAQYYILLNTVIPISLVVSIEFVKLV